MTTPILVIATAAIASTERLAVGGQGPGSFRRSLAKRKPRGST
jgi:hypothetical protein